MSDNPSRRAVCPDAWSQRAGAWAIAAVASLAILTVIALVLSLMGRSLLPQGVPLQMWSVSTASADNSQHLVDPFSLLHAVAGWALYPVLRRSAGGSLPVLLPLVIACSGVWEIVENTPAVIGLFNDPASVAGYHGDSIVNALTDTGFVAMGFLAAQHLPWRVGLLAAVMAELSVTLMVQDGFVIGTVRIVLRLAGAGHGV